MRKLVEETYGEVDGLKVHQLFQNLSSLGHIDLTLDQTELNVTQWNVAIPTLCATNDHSATLTGLRSLDMLETLTSEAHSADIAIDILPKNNKVDGDYPTVYKLAYGSSGQLENFCEKFSREFPKYGLTCAFNFSETLASQLPSFGRILNALPPMQGLAPQRYETWQPIVDNNGKRKFEWVNDNAPTEDGLRKFPLGNTSGYALTHKGTWYRVTNQVGKYLHSRLHESPLITWNQQHQTLQCPKDARLPGLYERSVVLCSGVPPQDKSGEFILEYTNVNEEVASMIYQAIYEE